MKKIIAILAAIALVGVFSASAMAADWAFYGHARMSTFWESEDFGARTNESGDDSDDDLVWFVQGNSRIGATVKHDTVTGGFEYGTGVNLRKLYGEWDFGSGKLMAGQNYTPITVFYSDQVWDTDLGLLGFGNQYGSRRGLLQLTFGDFKIAGIAPSSSTLNTEGDIDTYIPKFEAAYNAKFDAGTVDIYGGFASYQIDRALQDDVTVSSYMFGIGGSLNFGAGNVKASVSYYQNGSEAGWSIGNGFGAVVIDDDVKDEKAWQGLLLVNFKASDMVNFQGGGGFVQTSSDRSAVDEDLDWMIYLQAKLDVAKGVDIIPEIGYWDRDEDAFGVDEGKLFYLGARWRIRF